MLSYYHAHSRLHLHLHLDISASAAHKHQTFQTASFLRSIEALRYLAHITHTHKRIELAMQATCAVVAGHRWTVMSQFRQWLPCCSTHKCMKNDYALFPGCVDSLQATTIILAWGNQRPSSIYLYLPESMCFLCFEDDKSLLRSRRKSICEGVSNVLCSKKQHNIHIMTTTTYNREHTISFIHFRLYWRSQVVSHFNMCSDKLSG